MGVNLSGSTPANPSGPVSWLGTMEDSAQSLGSGLADGLLGLLGGIGQVLAGVVGAVGSVFSAVVDGVTTMLGWIGNAIGSIFGGSAPAPVPGPMPTIFNPIKTNLEQTLEPYFTKTDQALAASAALSDQITTINGNLTVINGEVTDLNADLVSGLDVNNPSSPLWSLQIGINDANARFQEQQIMINELQVERDDLQDKTLQALRDAQEAQTQMVSRTIYIPRNTPVEDTYFSITATSNGSQWKITAKPGWVGFFTFQTVYNSNADPAIDGFKVDTTREWLLPAFNRHQSILNYWVQPGKAVIHDDMLTTKPITISEDTWVTLSDLTFTAPQTDIYPLFFRVGWENANYWDGHGVRIRRNGTEIWRKGVGTIGPLVGHEYRTQTIDISDHSLNAGDVLTFQAYAAGSNSVNRIIRNAWFKTGWIAPPDPDDIQT